MKKCLIVLLSAAVMFIPGCKKEGDVKNDLKTLKLREKIKSIRSIEYVAREESGKIVKKERSSTSYRDSYTVFNDKGNITELDYFNPNAILSERRLMKYDENNNIIEETWYTPEGAPKNRFTSRYDKKGNMIEVTCFTEGSDKCNLRIVYRYDDKGNQIEREDYHPCDKSSSRIVMKYDDRGNMLELVFTGLDGKYGLIIMNTYDAANNLIEYCEGQNRESIYSKKTYKYDDKGNCIELSENRIDFSYHSKEVFQYEYDSKGNWIKQIKFMESSSLKPVAIVEREIRYFE